MASPLRVIAEPAVWLTSWTCSALKTRRWDICPQLPRDRTASSTAFLKPRLHMRFRFRPTKIGKNHQNLSLLFRQPALQFYLPEVFWTSPKFSQRSNKPWKFSTTLARRASDRWNLLARQDNLLASDYWTRSFCRALTCLVTLLVKFLVEFGALEVEGGLIARETETSLSLIAGKSAGANVH